MRHTRELALICLMLAGGPSAAFAADEIKSGVMGKVVSSETGEPLGFASIGFFLESAAPGTPEAKPKGVVGKGDGTYRIALPPGSYRAEVQFISYQTLKVTGVVVKADEFVTLDLPVTPSVIQLKTVEVTAQEIRNSESAVLSKRKKAPAASDAVSAEEIQKTADSNVAEVATRVTGVSIVGDRYVYIRGLGERYNSTLLNGATMATPEPERRVVPLDLFPADLVDNLVVQKSYTPDMPGDFAGGAVDINTREFPGKRTYSFSISSGYNSSTTGKEYLNYAGGKRDNLGFDDGTRELPDMIKDAAANEPIREQGSFSSLGFPADSIEAFGKSFNKTWTPDDKDGAPAYSFAGSYGDEKTVFDRQLGIFGGASYKNNFQSYDFEKNVFESQSTDGLLTPTATYDGASSENEVLWGALLHSSYRINDGHTISLRGMYDRSSEDEVRIYEGYEGDTSQRPIRDTRFLFVERGLFSGSVESEHLFQNLNNSKVHLRASYSQSERNEPDRREYVYEYVTRYTEDPGSGETDTTSAWELSSVSPDRSFTRFFSQLDDIERGFDGNWSLPIEDWEGREARLKAGFAYKNKDRDFMLRRFSFTQPLPGAGIDLTEEPQSLMADENITGSRLSGFTLEERTRVTDNYRGSHDLGAGFLMADFSVTNELRAVTGVRVETSDQRILTEDILYHNEPPIHAQLTDNDILPSINLTYTLTPTINLRGSYFKTLARPELREIAPYSIANYQGDFEEEGNPELQRSLIHNFDLRGEFFPGPSEVLAVSAFYKQLIDPIEKSVQGGDDPVYKPINGQGGYLYGVELESRIGLERISSPLSPINFNGNLTLVHSETELDRLGIQYSQKRPLEGQSPYVANFGFSFASAKERTQAALFYNVFGRRIRYVGFGTLPDIYEEPRQSLDLTASYALRGTRLKLSCENILNSDTRYKQGSQTTDFYEKGRSFTLALSYGSRGE